MEMINDCKGSTREPASPGTLETSARRRTRRCTAGVPELVHGGAISLPGQLNQALSLNPRATRKIDTRQVDKVAVAGTRLPWTTGVTALVKSLKPFSASGKASRMNFS